jgi:AraC-like DNA-binding protein
LESLGRSLAESLQKTFGIVELLGAYNAALRRLAVAATGSPGAGLGMQGFLAWLEENFRRPLNLATVARQAGLSVPAFTRAFRKSSGQSFAAWLRRRRCQEAALLLRGTSLSVAEVGRQCGFSAVHPFLRAFRQAYGKSPGAWRSKAAKSPYGQNDI